MPRQSPFRAEFRALWAIIFMGIFSGDLFGQHPQPGIDDFLRKIPGDANLVAVLKASPNTEAAREDRRTLQNVIGIDALPVGANLVVRGAHFHPENSRDFWTVSVIGFSSSISMESVARHEEASLELVGPFPAVKSPRNAYFGYFGAKTLGVMSPAYRQDFVRWSRFAKENSHPVLSPYLQSALGESPGELSMACDLSEAFDPKSIAAWVDSHRWEGVSPNDQILLAKLIGRLQGIRLSVHLHPTPEAALSLDFHEGVVLKGDVFRQVVLNFMADSHTSIDEFATARVISKPKSITLMTPLSDAGIRQIASLLLSPSPAQRLENEPSQEATGTVNLAMTRRYFDSVSGLISDLESKYQRATDYTRTATWHDNYATKIEQIAIRGIDREVANWGADAAKHLRALAASLRGVDVEISSLEKSVTYKYKVQPERPSFNIWGGWGWQPPTWEVNSNLEDVRKQQAEAVKLGSQKRDEIWQRLKTERSELRRLMLEKYKQDFDSKN